MKKKITVFLVCALIFSAVMSTICFAAIFNYQYTDDKKEELYSYNKMISSLIKDENNPLNIFDKLKNNNIRITYIDAQGRVLYDSGASSNDMDNHLNRDEIKAALLNKNGYEIRYSDTLKQNMMYYATKDDKGYIIRTSIPIKNIDSHIDRALFTIVLMTLGVTLLTAIISLKFVRIVVKPLKDLEKVAYSMSRGQLDKRVYINSDDELGKLGEALNYMADKLDIALNELKEKQERLEAILISMNSGVIAVNRDYNVIMINPYAEKMFGVTDEIIGKKLIDHIRDVDFYSIFDSERDDREITIINPEKRHLRIKTADIIDSKGYKEHLGKVIVVQDITDLRNMENMRTQFVANVSHELKTPLTSIKGFAETLLDVDDEKIRQKFLTIINNEADRLSRIITDLLEISTMEKNEDKKEIQDEMVRFNPEPIISEALDIIRVSAKKKNITLNLDMNGTYCIKGIPDKFKQAMIILIDNAVKYTEDNGSVFVKSYTDGQFVMIEVSDTGIGIPEKDLPRIFERFYRVDKARSRQKGGTGLGLSILKHIMILFKADINVKSTLGKGTTFTMKFKGE